MFRKFLARILITSLLFGCYFGLLLGFIDAVRSLSRAGLEARGVYSLFFTVPLGWILLCLPGCLVAWILVSAIGSTPRFRVVIQNHAPFIMTAFAAACVFTSLMLVFTFKMWLPHEYRLKSWSGLFIALGLLILGILFGAGIGWIAGKLRSPRLRIIRAGLIVLGIGIPVFAVLFTFLEDRQVAAQTFQNTSDESRPSIIIILLDALRADGLGCYGSRETTTPAMDQIAREGVLYRNAFTTATWTRPAMASLWTGLYPSTHSVQHGHGLRGKEDRLNSLALTLAEVMKDGGYGTFGFNTNVMVDTEFGLDQGFDHYYTFTPPAFGKSFLADAVASALTAEYTPNSFESGGNLTDMVIKFLGNPLPRPMLLYVHYMDVHEPYWENHGALWSRATQRNNSAYKDLSRLYYLRGIDYADRAIDRLVTHLKSKGLYDNSLVIVTADHGEEFFEHGCSAHSHNLTEEQIHIPLIVKFPRGEHAGLQIDNVVSLVDVAPTVLRVAGLEIPPVMQGKALTPSPPEGSIAFCELGNTVQGNRALNTSEWRYLHRYGSNRMCSTVPFIALFNRKEDPNDRQDVSADHPDIVADLQARMDQHFEWTAASALPQETAPLNDETRERMKALGYLQ